MSHVAYIEYWLHWVNMVWGCPDWWLNREER